MQVNELYIVLGCFGRTDDDFISCSGLQNTILVISQSLHNHVEIMNYLDSCRLFDRQLLDYNAIRNFVYNLYNKFDQPSRKLWSEKQFRLYQKFVIDHRDCGLFVKLDMSS